MVLIPVLDRLIFYYQSVSVAEFDSFQRLLDRYELLGFVPAVARWIGKGFSEYHYNLRIGASSEGAVHVAYQHNSEKPTKGLWDVRVEFNPSKYDEHNKTFLALQEALGSRRTVIKGMDIAFDLPIPPDAVYVIPKNGREENRVKGTRYYGSRGKNGFTRVYDKKKERQDAGFPLDIETPLTRIEFCLRIDKGGMGREVVSSLNWGEVIASYYDIYKLGVLDDDLKAEVRCMVIGVMQGFAQVKEFTRTNQRKIKNVLEGTEKLALDSSVQEHWDSISRIILKFTYDYLQSESTKQYSSSDGNVKQSISSF